MTKDKSSKSLKQNLRFMPCASSNKEMKSISVTFVDQDVESSYETSFALTGWAIPFDGIPNTLVITNKGMIVGAESFQYERPDALTKLNLKDINYKPGFHLRINTICLNKNANLEVWVDLKRNDGNLLRVKIGEIENGVSGILQKINNSRYSPIIVPALGRSGTTLMMTLLNSHPNVIAPGQYPYEYRQASYLWHALRILTSPANFQRSMHPDSFETDYFYKLGYNPFISRMYEKAHNLNNVADWQDKVFPVELINFVKNMVDQYLDSVVSDSTKENVKYLAEKTNVSPMNDLVMNVYPNAKQIFLVRDLRDSFISAKAFNKKRGTTSFGFEGKSDQQVLAGRAQSANLMVQAKVHADDRVLFIRYEDIILKQKNTLTLILDFLGLDQSPEVVKSMMASLQAKGDQRSLHATSTDVASSIERWRNELSLQDQEYCSQAYKLFFETFGYPVK